MNIAKEKLIELFVKIGVSKNHSAADRLLKDYRKAGLSHTSRRPFQYSTEKVIAFFERQGLTKNAEAFRNEIPTIKPPAAKVRTGQGKTGGVSVNIYFPDFKEAANFLDRVKTLL